MSHLKSLLIKLSLPIVTLSLFPLVVSHRTMAISLGSYKAVSTRRVDQKRTVGSGSRSPVCKSSWEKDSLTLLIPEEEVVHYTASSNPTLYIHAKQTSAIPLMFSLVNLEASNNGTPILEKKIVVNKLGINKISIPPNISLENNKLYLWQIGFPCEEDSTTSVAKIVKGAIEKVALTNELLNELSRNDSSIEKAKIYARSGIWYNALDLAQLDEDSSFLKLLLEEANLDISLEER